MNFSIYELCTEKKCFSNGPTKVWFVKFFFFFFFRKRVIDRDGKIIGGAAIEAHRSSLIRRNIQR
jgi:hypothetical protein